MNIRQKRYKPVTNPYDGFRAEAYEEGFHEGVKTAKAEGGWQPFGAGMDSPSRHGYNNGFGVGYGDPRGEYIEEMR